MTVRPTRLNQYHNHHPKRESRGRGTKGRRWGRGGGYRSGRNTVYLVTMKRVCLLCVLCASEISGFWRTALYYALVKFSSACVELEVSLFDTSDTHKLIILKTLSFYFCVEGI